MFLSTCLLLALCTATDPVELPLWPDGVPGAAERPTQEVMSGAPGDRHVRDVHVPTLTVYRPAQQAAPVPAVVICPGGGYGVLALDKEGHDIARWLAENGVCGVVLKYRLPRPSGHVFGEEAPLADARRALQLVRARAGEWQIDGERVGIMGFSAGGHLAASASTLLDEQRPDFSVLIYPVVSMRDPLAHRGSRANLLGKAPSEALLARFSSEEHIDALTPPAFLVHTADDPVQPAGSMAYASALMAAGVSVELHLFKRGGHGYAMRKPDLPVGSWPALLLAWLADR